MTSAKWRSDSEIVCGFVLKDKLDPFAVNPKDVYPAYQQIVILKRDGAEMPSIVDKVQFENVHACLDAATAVNGDMSPHGYLENLEKNAGKARVRAGLDIISNKLDDGKDVDGSELMEIMNQMQVGYKKWIPMSEVEPQTVKFVRTGYAPLDKHTGGIPYACVTIIAATPGIGKTTLGLKIVESMLRLKENKNKKVAILSLEMTMGQIHQRYVEISKMTKEEKSRVLLNRIFNIQEICAAVTQLCAKEKICSVLIDFADLIIEGEQTESAMGVVYKNLEVLATQTEVPVILIAQLNRATYDGGIPKINHIRNTRLAEACSRMVLLLYNPLATATSYDPAKSVLPVSQGRGYIIVGKSNFGYKEGNPGAIQVEWDGAAGWGEKSFAYYKISG